MKSEAVRLRKRISNQKVIAKIKTADVLYSESKFDVALDYYNQALSQIDKTCEYDICECYRKIGNVYYAQKKLDEARVAYEKTLNYCTTNASIYAILAYLYYYIESDKSIEYYTKAIQMNGSDCASVSSKNLSILKSSKYSQEEIKNTLEKEIEKHRKLILNGDMPYEYDKDKLKNKKKLNIGYLSSDFNCHAMMQFVLPILEWHNKNKFNFSLYYTNNKVDYVTLGIKNLGMNFYDCQNLSNKELAKKIHDDGIDILIDLSGYTGTSCYSIYYKPAPIIAQYLGFVNTMGMKEIDYIITDEFTIPKDKAPLYTEKPLYLNTSMQRFCFSNPNIKLPQINEIPYEKNGYITFGSFNCTSKISDYTIELWAKLLKYVDNSKILFYRTQMTPKVIERIKSKFEEFGILSDRLIFNNIPCKDMHFYAYQLADIALDPIPFNGLTVTIELISMGIPVISIIGESMQARGCARINKALKLDDLIAANEDEYIKKANKLAHDIKKIKYYRKNLRNILFKSFLMNDYKGFVNKLESAYLKAWNDYINPDAKKKKSIFCFR